MCYQILVLILYISLAACAMAPTHLLVTRAGPCPDSERTPITVSELSLFTRPDVSLLSGEFNVSEDIENGWKVKVTMQKCVDIRNVESCDFFRSFYLMKDGCSDEEKEDSYNKILFHYAQPKICRICKFVTCVAGITWTDINPPAAAVLRYLRLECPIKAGRYKIIHYPIFTEDNHLVVAESKISTSVFGYTFRLDGLTENRRKLFCVDALLQLMYTRKHNWEEKPHIKDIGPTPGTVSGEGET